MKGRQRDIFPIGNKTVITLEIDVKAESLDGLSGKELEVEIKPFKAHRSLDANAYFHVLCDKLRQILNIPMAECKNHLIASYGQIEYLGEEQAIIKTNIPPETMLKNEYLHTWCVKINLDGTYMYRVYRGSHTYNSAEMARLIDGTILECRAQGIETATPEELQRMEELWRRKHG